MDEFRLAGRLHYYPPEIFARQSWLAVQVGQFIEPLGYHPLVDARPQVNAIEYMNRQVSIIRRMAESMPRHEAFIERNCKSDFAAVA
jgi:tryptophan halogenase